MAAEPVLKISVVPEIGDLSDMIGQLRRTGESLIAAADALQRLSDGGPDAARTEPDSDGDAYLGSVHEDPGPLWPDVAHCPAVQRGTEHDGHGFAVSAQDPDNPYAEPLRSEWRCPGFPIRPWHMPDTAGH